MIVYVYADSHIHFDTFGEGIGGKRKSPLFLRKGHQKLKTKVLNINHILVE